MLNTVHAFTICEILCSNVMSSFYIKVFCLVNLVSLIFIFFLYLQHLHWPSKVGNSRYDFTTSPGHTEGSSRPRINSVFIGHSSRLSPDFHVCRKVRSAEDIPLQPMGVFNRPEVIAITEHQDLEEIQQV